MLLSFAFAKWVIHAFWCLSHSLSLYLPSSLSVCESVCECVYVCVCVCERERERERERQMGGCTLFSMNLEWRLPRHYQQKRPLHQFVTHAHTHFFTRTHTLHTRTCRAQICVWQIGILRKIVNVRIRTKLLCVEFVWVSISFIPSFKQFFRPFNNPVSPYSVEDNGI